MFDGTPATAFTDDGSALLTRLQKLKHLSMQVTNSGLQHIGRIHSLRELNISCSPIDDRGVQALTGLTNLTMLNIMATGIRQEGLDVIKTSLRGLTEFITAFHVVSE